MGPRSLPASAPADRQRRRRRGGLLVLLVTLGALSVGSGTMSLAVFTDSESVDAVFTTGTVVLDPVKIDALTLTTSAMMPGDSVTDDVVVENDGTAQLRYALSTTSTNADGLALRDALTLTVRTVDVTTPGTPCDNFDGTSLYSGVLGASTASFGNPASGAHSGDRTLNAGANETLCFRVSLPIGTGNGLQGATTTTTFTFDAEQTANT
jgi:predicted ribosomally synthesized peptide with SipW-like signal peptide